MPTELTEKSKCDKVMITTECWSKHFIWTENDIKRS